MNLTCFRNGDAIIQAQSKEDWENAIKEAKPAWCFFHNDSLNQDKIGKLYNIYAVLDPRGLAPEGWQIPTENDWQLLKSFLGEDIASKLKATEGWNKDGNGNNETGFTAYPSGTRTDYGAFNAKGATAYYWSLANNPEIESSGGRYLCSWDTYLNRTTISTDGYAVRCIKK